MTAKTKATKTIAVGLVAGRHDMPVSDYVFDKIDNVLDFDTLKQGVAAFIKTLPTKKGIEVITDASTYTDYYIPREQVAVNLDVYVTGLTAVTIELVSQLKDLYWGENVVRFMHYDRDTDTYIPQVVL